MVACAFCFVTYVKHAFFRYLANINYRLLYIMFYKSDVSVYKIVLVFPDCFTLVVFQGVMVPT